MRNRLFVGVIAVMLIFGCTERGDPNFYKEIMINGDILTSHIDALGYPIAEVKYDGKLYKCTGGSRKHCKEI